ncbi:3,4-dihydroxy-2-butanone 4-phosphate synthase [Candidatus Entotheonellaceae bacterium PAL068K]
MAFVTTAEALQDIRQGKMIILCDDERRENEADLCMAADKVTPEAITFMARYGCGLICLAMAPEFIDRLALPMMVKENTSRHGTAFTVSIDAYEGTSTGISAADRARTIQVAITPCCRPQDLARPGHIFPLRARPRGVLERGGQTEGAVDLTRLAGLQPAGVICEVMNVDGTMARGPQLERFAALNGLKILTIAELVRYRRTQEGG